MGKNSAPKPPEKPSSTYKIGDRTVANAFWDGNDYVTKYNPTAQENQSMNYLQSALPSAFASATDTAGANDFADRYYQNQVKQVNEAINPQMTSLKDSLITGGQIGGSTGWNKIKTFSDSYSDTIADLAANKETNALNYKNNLLGYANNLQGSLNNYYNLASGNSQSAAGNQQAGWGQNYQQYQTQLQSYQAQQQANQQLYNNIMGGVKMAGSIALAPVTGGGSLLGNMASKTGGRL